MKYLIPFLLSASALFACASGLQKREAEADPEADPDADPTFPILGSNGVILSSPNGIRRVYHVYQNKHGRKHYRYRHGGTRKTKRRTGKRSSGDDPNDRDGSADSINTSYSSQDNQPFYYNYLDYSKRSADSPDVYRDEDRNEDHDSKRNPGNRPTIAPDNNADSHLFHRDFIHYTKRSADSGNPSGNPDGNFFHHNFLHYVKRSADPGNNEKGIPDNNPYNYLFHKNFLHYTKRSIANDPYSSPYTGDFVINDLLKRSAYPSDSDDLSSYDNLYNLDRYDDLSKRSPEDMLFLHI